MATLLLAAGQDLCLWMMMRITMMMKTTRPKRSLMSSRNGWTLPHRLLVIPAHRKPWWIQRSAPSAKLWTVIESHLHWLGSPTAKKKTAQFILVGFWGWHATSLLSKNGPRIASTPVHGLSLPRRCQCWEAQDGEGDDQKEGRRAQEEIVGDARLSSECRAMVVMVGYWGP